MAKRTPQGRLELTWMGKDQALVPDPDGKYDYSWIDPSDPRATEVKTLETLRTVGEEGSARENLAIIGESGDALRSLSTAPELADKYAGQVKLVYIDPPFNTGQTFDSYEDQLEHSVWLTMMRDRLSWLRPLLAQNASVWVHLDDVEVHRMRSLLDEEFGAENFVGQVTWRKGVHVRNDSQKFSSNSDFILVYRMPQFEMNKLEASQEMLTRYSSPDGDPRPWQSIASGAPGARTHQGMVHGIQHPVTGEILYPPSGNCWRYGQETMQALLEDWDISYRQEDIGDAPKRAEICGLPQNRVRQGVKALMLDLPVVEARERVLTKREKDVWPQIFFTRPDATGGMRIKNYVPEKDFGRVPATLWDDLDRNDDAKRHIKTLFPEEPAFATPKPENLLERVLKIGTDPGDLVLDFFGGSGTTAAVAHKMDRRWVTVELHEDNAERYLVPRLTKVVDGSDQGGVSATVERVSNGELPGEVTPEEAKSFTSVLNKIAKRDDVEIPKDVLRAIRKAAKTSTRRTVNWSGGGGFTVAKVGPTMYEVDDDSGDVYLSEAATNGVWSRAVAGQLGFRVDDEPPFVGTKGRMRLAVLDGMVADADIENLAGYLSRGERMTVVAKQVLPGTEERLKELAPGSRLRRAPDQIIGGTV